MFASRYLTKNNNKALIQQSPSVKTGISIIIPCFREPQILDTLRSLKHCEQPKANVEVIVLINHAETASEEIRKFNRETKQQIEEWISENRSEKITFFAVGPVELKKKWAGAGLARKSGMDEAVRRFDELNRPDGVLVSLDADTLVQSNYLVEIENYFSNHPEIPGATIAFSHQTTGLKGKHLQGIRLYEKYMEYYKKALDYTGYPYPMFTVGSAFAATAGAYVKRGGMNRRQAGEDFYFLQNLAQIGTVGEITTTKVFPSARLSDRVPFGTGPILRKWMDGKEDLTLTYNFNAFADLKKLFSKKEHLFKIDETEFSTFISSLPESVCRFIIHDNFQKEIIDLNKNCSGLKTFQNRFFQKFNAFKILKFLNFSHERFYSKANLDEQIEKLKKAGKNGNGFRIASASCLNCD